MPTLELADATIAYERAGDAGPPVLLVQGVGALGECWRPQIDGLAADHRLAWHDNRGIGRSLPRRGPVTIPAMAADCLALVDHLGWPEVHLVGHSMGGLIVQEAARQAPDRVRSLSLLSTSPRGRPILMISLAAFVGSLRMRFGAEPSRWAAFARLGFPPAYVAEVGVEPLVAALRRGFCEGFVRTPPIVRAQLGALWRDRGRDLGALREIPTLIATGAQDHTVRSALSDELLACLPHARLERFADAGHALPIQHADAINQLLRRHIAAAEGSGAPIH
ncbi:MAG: alpha/beta fold hydrolase [Myxococcales bacterium]|nr:alpha/beta fold hydrolase [Myxococcales bacterium]